LQLAVGNFRSLGNLVFYKCGFRTSLTSVAIYRPFYSVFFGVIVNNLCVELYYVICKMSSNLEDVQIVIETIDSAINARFQLSHLLDGVSEAKNQVVSMYCSYRASPVTSRAGPCDPLAAASKAHLTTRCNAVCLKTTHHRISQVYVHNCTGLPKLAVHIDLKGDLYYSSTTELCCDNFFLHNVDI